MKPGRFATQLATLRDAVLKPLDLILDATERVAYPSDLPRTVRGKSYREEWKYYLDNRLFHFCLVDLSLLLFRPSSSASDGATYCYYESPIDAPTYERFLAETLDTTFDAVRDAYWNEYQEHVSQCPQKESITPIRYDHSPNAYEAGVHPAAHIHFGHNSEIRVATERLMTPLSFGLLVVRQAYPNKWRSLVLRTDSHTICECIRDRADPVPPKFLTAIDRRQHFLA